MSSVIINVRKEAMRVARILHYTSEAFMGIHLTSIAQAVRISHITALGESTERSAFLESDSDMEDDELVAMPTALQRVNASGFLKRTYASHDHSCMEPKLDQQLDGLRAVVPHNSTRRRDRNDSTVLDAYCYIATLQKQVEDLSSEPLENDSLAQVTRDEERDAGALPMVEVTRRNGALEVHIVCANRPGLLVDVMEAVESRGLTVMHAEISCHSDTVFEHLTLESQEEGDEEEVDSVRTMLVNAICGSNLE